VLCFHMFVQGMQHFRGLQLHSSDLTDPSLLAGANCTSSTSTSSSNLGSCIAYTLSHGDTRVLASTAEVAV
jgi:hypothetical protein